MSAVAEALPHLTDDNLARRNARVLAVAQALAGGNNTVIVSTASIVGATAYLVFQEIGVERIPAALISMIAVAALRMAAIWLGLRLPVFHVPD
jgi:hypothetical protein